MHLIKVLMKKKNWDFFSFLKKINFELKIVLAVIAKPQKVE